MLRKSNQSKSLHIALWLVQIILAVSLLWAGTLKLMQPVDELATMWPWVSQVPVALVKFTGVVDLLGALGLILPSLLRVQPRLTPIAAIGIVLLMVCASVFHIARGEASLIGVNVGFAALAAFVAWGRLIRVPVPTT